MQKRPKRARSAKRAQQAMSAYALLGVGFEFAAIFLICWGAGWLGDIYLASGRPGIATLIGIFLGLGASLWHLYRRAQEIQRRPGQSQERELPLHGEQKRQERQEQISRTRQEIGSIHKRIRAVVERQEKDRSRKRGISDGEPGDRDQQEQRAER